MKTQATVVTILSPLKVSRNDILIIPLVHSRNTGSKPEQIIL